MTELVTWPLDNKEYTSVALGAAYAARSRGLLTAQSFSAATNGDNTVTLSPGVACLHVTEWWACFPGMTTAATLALDDADGSFDRLDVIALTLDKNANAAGLEVIKGTPSAAPVRPTPRRDSDYDEIFLYEVRRPVGAVKITVDQITDLRLDAEVCGLMRDTIDHIDTSVMQAAFDGLLARIGAELDRLNAGTEVMLKSTYDPDGDGTVDAAADAAALGGKAPGYYAEPLYAATLLVDGWAGSGPYTQTAACTPQDGGPVLTAATRLMGPMCRPTGTQATDEALQAALGIVNSGTTAPGAGTVTVKVWERPDCDLTVTWPGRG